MASLDMADFLRGVKGTRVLRALFLRAVTAVPAWEDAVECRLKMALPKDRATDQPDKLVELCRNRPGAMMILPDRLAVLDIDCKNGNNGWMWLAENVPGWLPTRAMTRTPRGGAHIAVLLPEGFVAATSVAHAPGVDILGARAIATMPGSRSSLGAYAPVEADYALARAPDALLKLLKPRVEHSTKPASRVIAARTTPSGRVQLTRFAAGVVGEGDYLRLALNRAGFMAGLNADEIAPCDLDKLIESACHRGMSEKTARQIAERGYHEGLCREKRRSP